jgi:hypothetical protein
VSDPKRIERMVDKLGVLWRLHPEWRLGQLIVNVTTGDGYDPYTVQDNDLEDAIDRWMLHHAPQRAKTNTR